MKLTAVFLIALVVSLICLDRAHGQRKSPRRPKNQSQWKRILQQHDEDKDGRITKDEFPRGDEHFTRLDRNGDGALTDQDWIRNSDDDGKQRRGGKGKTPRVGQLAPDFELSSARMPSKRTRLSSFAGQKPVALIFGSCT